MIPLAGTCRLSFAPAPNQRHHFAHANQTRKAGFPAPRVACLFSLHKTDSWSTQVASVPLYVRAPLRNHPVVPFRLCGALCPSFPYMASHPPVFNGEATLFFLVHHLGDGTGSRARTYDLRFWRPPLYQLSYARTRAFRRRRFLKASARSVKSSQTQFHMLCQKTGFAVPCQGIGLIVRSAALTISRPAACKARRAHPSPRRASARSPDRRSRRDWNSSSPAAIPIRRSP